MVNITLCNAKSAVGIDQDCLYQLPCPCVIYSSVPSVCLDGFLGS